jgi:hypothetical protein
MSSSPNTCRDKDRQIGTADDSVALANVELQRPALALDPFDLVLQNLVCLLRLFELDA